MLSKGAVVIVKHGDKEIADAIEQGLDVRYPKENRDEHTCKTELAAIARQKDIAEKYEKAKAQRDPIKIESKVKQRIKEGFALIVYVVSVFIDKFLRIKE